MGWSRLWLALIVIYAIFIGVYDVNLYLHTSNDLQYFIEIFRASVKNTLLLNIFYNVLNADK